MILDSVRNAIQNALTEASIGEVSFSLEYSGDLERGDLASNVALVAAKAAGKNPKELGTELAEILSKKLPDGISKVETAGPGFINFYFAREEFAKTVESIGESWGRNEEHTGEKIGIEYYQPNFFKALHVGHLLNAMVGESLARLMEFSGATVYRIAYYADIGPHIAKAIWGLQELAINPETPEDLSRAYEYGSLKYKEDSGAKEVIDEINRKIYQGEDEKVQRLYKQGTEISKIQVQSLLDRLGISFDKTFYETEGGEIGKSLVLERVGEVFEKSEGAIIFRGESYGLHTRVFLTSKELPVYETKDLGLAKLKLDAFSADRLLYVVDVEQTGYFNVILKVIELVFPALQGKVKHVAHGRLRLPDGRMSSREGKVILANEILNELQEAVLPRAGEKKIAEQVGQAAMHYLILRQSLGSNIVFDKNQALSFEGDSGPYLQYSYVRAMSVLQKSSSTPSIDSPTPHVPKFERMLPRFPHVVSRAISEYEPHHVTTYLTELAAAFNSWYASERIIDTLDEAYKLQLVQAFATTMKNGMWLLGIEAPEKM